MEFLVPAPFYQFCCFEALMLCPSPSLLVYDNILEPIRGL